MRRDEMHGPALHHEAEEGNCCAANTDPRAGETRFPVSCNLLIPSFASIFPLFFFLFLFLVLVRRRHEEGDRSSFHSRDVVYATLSVCG